MSDMLVSYSIDGATAESRDGVKWFRGPAAPMLDAGSLEGTAVGTSGLVVVGWQEADNQSHSWLIPRNEFEDDAQLAVPVDAASLPSISVRLPTRLR